MKKNRLGSSDIYVSPLTLGSMSLGTDKKEGVKIIHEALERGINHIDTADLYGFGGNEEIVGEALKHKREKVVLTTKVGNHFHKERETSFWDPSKQHIEQAVKESLIRLQTDYIDLYLLHGGTIEDDIDETIDTFERLKESGVIRAYGISSIRPNVIHEYVERSNMDVVMMQYSMLDRRPEQLLNKLHKHSVSVLARGPLAKGILSKDALKQLDRKGSDGFLQYDAVELQKVVSELKKLNEPVTKLAFHYVLHHPAVASAVFGVSTMQQLEENMSYTISPQIDDKLYKQIREFTKKFRYTAHQ